MESLMNNVLSSVNKDNLMCSFCICIPFICFSCIITAASASNSILKISGARGELCSFFYFNKIVFRFSLLKMMLIAVSHMFLYSVIFLQTNFLYYFYNGYMLDFLKPFVHLLRWICL